MRNQKRRMADLRYNGDYVNNGVSSLYNICDKFPSIAASVKSATNKLLSAKGFNQCVSGVSSNTFSDVVNNCQAECGELARNIRQKQVDILGYSQDDKAIQSFLDEINNSEYKSLDLSSIESHISFGRKATNFLKGAGSTAVEFGLGLGEGLGKFGETAYDLGDIALTGAKSLFASKDEVNKMWEECKARVSTEHVKSYFDDLYSENEFLSDVKNNALGGQVGREIGKGLGYAAGMIGLNAITGGLAGPGAGLVGFSAKAGQLATTAAVMGFSKHTEEAWNDGATVSGGLKYGAAAGAWEGVQWYLGAKINAIGGEAVAGQVFRGGLGSVGARIGLSSVDSGMEGVVNPALKTLYKDYGHGNFVDNYKAAFLEAGGAKNIFKNVAMGAIGATFGEMVEAGQAMAAAKGAPVESIPDFEGSADVVAREKAIYAFKKKYPELVEQYGDDLVDAVPIETLIEKNDLEFDALTDAAYEMLGNPTRSINIAKLSSTSGYVDDIADWLKNSAQYDGDIDEMAEKMAMELFASNNFSKIKANHLAAAGKFDDAVSLIHGASLYGSSENTAKLFRSLETYGDTSTTRDVAFSLADFYKKKIGYDDEGAADKVYDALYDAIEERGFLEKTITLSNGKDAVIKIPKNLRTSSNNQTSLDEFIESIQNIPEPLLDAAPKEYFYYDTFNPNDLRTTVNPDFADSLSDDGTFWAAMTHFGDGNKIAVWNCCSDPDAMVHECGHAFDSFNGAHNISNSADWSNAVNADHALTGIKSITSYGASRPKGREYSEDFAESVYYYFLKPEYFKQKCPNRAKLLKQIFGV